MNYKIEQELSIDINYLLSKKKDVLEPSKPIEYAVRMSGSLFVIFAAVVVAVVAVVVVDVVAVAGRRPRSRPP